MKQNSEQSFIIASAEPINPYKQIPTGGSGLSLLIYGGVAVAVILAMAYFSEKFFKGINTLIKTINKKD